MYKPANFDDSLLIDKEFDSFELDSGINADIDLEDIKIYEIDNEWPDSINY